MIAIKMIKNLAYKMGVYYTVQKSQASITEF